jgi:hypothetical protein
MSRLTNKDVKVHINDVKDFRNYKVSIQHAKLTLGFTPIYTIKDIVNELYQKTANYSNLEDERYYNIKVFKILGKI